MKTILKGKLLLYVGLLLLTIGLLFRYLSNYQIFAAVLVFIGIAGKLVYLISKLKAKNYNPGLELIILLIGLVVFFIGIYLRSQGISNLGVFFIIAGLTLKVGFILMFFRKVS